MGDDKRALRIHIQDLLDKCNGCEFNGVLSAPDLVHGHCPLYKEIREAGDKLAKMQRAEYGKLEITVPEYWKLHHEGLTDEDIAGLKHVNQSTIGHWKKKNGVRPEKQKPFPLTVEEYKRLSKEMNDKQLTKKLGLNHSTFVSWKKRNDLCVLNPKIRVSDDKVLQMIINGKSDWWITKHWGVGKARIFRIKKEHGIAR